MNYINKLTLLAFFLCPALIFAQSNDDEINNYVNNIQKELQSDVEKARSLTNYEYHLNQVEPGKDRSHLSSEKSHNGFSSFFSTIDEESNNTIDFFINYYSTVGKRKLEDSLERYARYFPVIKKYAEMYHLPVEISILGLLESHFKLNATSSNGGRGIWNLTKNSARVYNLMINDYIDERMDINKSTNVAFKYLIGLNEAYHGNWPMIIMAYNGGGAYLSQKIRQYQTVNFWDILNQEGSFKNQAIEYVPEFYAILTLLKHPGQYNLKVPAVNSNVIDFQVLKVSKSGVSFQDLAKSTNIPLSQLVAMNPQLYKQFTMNHTNLYVPARTNILVASRISSARSSHLRWLPSGTDISLGNNYRVAYHKTKALSTSKTKKVAYYSVRKKDTLFSIARNYHMSPSEIAKNNRLKKNSLLKVGQIIKVALNIPSSHSEMHSSLKQYSHKHHFASLHHGKRIRVALRNNHHSSQKVYRVKKGDTFFGIAKKYNVAMNRLKAQVRGTIKPGDKIIIE